MYKQIKNGMSLILVMSMLFMYIGVPMASAATTFKEDTLIELESTTFEKNFGAVSDKTASGGKYIVDKVSGSEKLTDPDSQKPEITVDFEASKDATYYVWLRHNAADDGKDSFFIGFNNEKINSEYGTSGNVTSEGVWSWKMVKSAALKAGKNTLKMYHREAGMLMDAVYITADANYKPADASSGTAVSPSASAVPSGATTNAPTPIGKTFELTDGSVIIEAEETASKGKIEIVSNATASAKKAITLSGTASRVDDAASFGTPAASYTFNVDKSGTYAVWLRTFVTGGGMDSLWANFDGQTYTQGALTVNQTDWTWAKVFTAKLELGVHTFNLIPRESGMQIDRILITNKTGYTPSGVGELPSKDSSAGPVLYPTPSILPPAGHPRVYFTKDDIPTILENAKKPQNASAWAKHESNLLDSAVDTIKPVQGSATNNFSAAVLGVIESRAFDYAIRGNETMGKKAVTAMRNYINVASGGDYNAFGQTIFTIAAVYDWCYPLLTNEDKAAFSDATTNFASQMEIGWPPTKQGAVTGHGVEGQLQRELMCAGIAMYDERPDIYLNVAGRFFKEYTAAKKFLYQAHMNMQGEHYTAYRAQWEILGALVMDAIGVPNVYGPDQQYELYWTLYARRPDGQVLRDGDSSKNNVAIGTYDSGYYRSLLLSGNYFNDPYLKWEGMRELPYMKAVNPNGNQSLNCVEFLIFNNPDLDGRPASELPLTKYFPEPKGGMIARTGWADGFDSPAVLAEMKINEYWIANHQHLDAGSFQIYYKGMLATDTGFYQAAVNKVGDTGNDGNTGYGSQHFNNYLRRSIAHNTMSVYDPNEPSSNFGGGVNDGGQRMPNNGSEINTLEQLQDTQNGYKISEILGHEFGEDPMEPNYTYLKGDLTKAYSEKLTGYQRSFMFLNLKNKEHPAAMLVFDRVVSSKESFKKAWLLHGLQEPTINGSQTVFKDTRQGYNGKLTVDTLLPKADNLIITTIGGPGKEFWVNGVNYDATLNKGGNNEGSGWRVEISPKTPSKDNYFLNVLQVGDANPDMPALPVTSIETDKVAGAVVADRVVVFGKEKARTKDAVEFSFAGDGEFEITVADLEKGTWQVTKDGAALVQASATDDGGVAVFKGTAGAYKLTYVNDVVNPPVIQVTTHQDEGIGIRVANRLIYTDVPPTIQNDRTLVPMRAIFEKLGVNVAYNDATATAIATKDGREVKITQDSKTAYIDGQPVELDVPATVINDRFLVPVRFVSEAFYAKVEWDDFAKIVNITPGAKKTEDSGSQAQAGYVTIKASKISNAFEGDGPATYDNNNDTLWSVSGYDGNWISYDFGQVTEVKGASIMWNKGDQRKAIFTIEVSNDEKSWKKVYDGMASGKAAFTVEDFLFPAGTKARYVRINCKGSDVGEWSAIIEIKFMK